MAVLFKVKYADDCEPCEHCGEPWCAECMEHYAVCACVGPCEEGEFTYLVIDGQLYARPGKSTWH